MSAFRYYLTLATGALLIMRIVVATTSARDKDIAPRNGAPAAGACGEGNQKACDSLNTRRMSGGPRWESSFRRCEVWKTFAENSARPGVFGNGDDVWVDGGTATIILSLDDILELQKHLPLLKKCNAFWQCVNDREAGKVKHCYENDRRWRQ
jgi:hypothetical protein